ncbi:hypothetical protein [Sulfurisphaera tokodaii]|nr:hypothetical protein [Sulfurisphaera tokodaii]
MKGIEIREISEYLESKMRGISIVASKVFNEISAKENKYKSVVSLTFFI